METMFQKRFTYYYKFVASITMRLTIIILVHNDYVVTLM